MKTRPLRTPLVVCFAAAFALPDPLVPARAAVVHTVTNCDDAGPGSLRDAVQGAANGDTVDLSQLNCSTITVTTGTIDIGVDNLTIAGPPVPAGSEAAITIRGNTGSRIFDHVGHGTLKLAHLDLVDGQANGDGGCMRSAGSVVLEYSSFSACRADQHDFQGRGGAIYTQQDLHVYGCRVTGNTAYGAYAAGGGIFVGGSATIGDSTISGNHALHGALAGGVYVRGTLSMDHSTIAGNDAGDVGGVFVAGNSGAEVSVSESTISGNVGDRFGGVLALQLPLNLYGSTVAANSARTGNSGSGGIALGVDGVFVSSIVAANTAAGHPADLARANAATSPVVTGHANLITAASISVPTDTIALDPMLAPLADNGGPTPTMALLPGSPAIDHGDWLIAKYDQREDGYARVVGANADIGAFEYGAHPDLIFANGFEPFTSPPPLRTIIAANAAATDGRAGALRREHPERRYDRAWAGGRDRAR